MTRIPRATPRAPRLTAGLAAVALALAAAAPADAQTVEHVFLFVIDGIRASEGFDDPSHGALAPLADLVEQGTVLTRLDITGQTVTLPAHHALVSGNRSDYGGTQPYEARINHGPRTPTLFEAYRRATGAGQGSCWVVGNTGYLHDTASSMMPGYGELYGASRALTYETLIEDDWAWDQVDEILADEEVALMLVNLHEVDRKGHEVDWDGYMGKADAAAARIAEFWDRLQADPVYAGTTALMVTTDHGRHLDEEESGWISHGCHCRGCRNAFLLAVGPGIRAGVQDDAVSSFLDLAPTVAHLMGFAMPYARGRVLTEILEDGDSVSRGPGGQHEPRLTRAGERLIRAHELHDPSLADDQGAHRVVVEVSEDHGESWTELFRGDDGWIQSGPMVRSHGTMALVGWLEQWAGGEEVRSRLARVDPAAGTVTELFDHEMTSSATSTSNLVVAGRGEPLVLAENNANSGITRFWLSEDDGDTWEENGPEPFVNPRYFPRDWQQMQAHEAWVAVFSAHVNGFLHPDIPNENTQVYAVYSANAGEEWNDEVAVSDGVEPSIQPRVVRSADGTLHLVWSELVQGTFQLSYAHSTNNGLGFSAPLPLTDAPLMAWEPALATDGDRVIVAWAQAHETDRASIKVAQVDSEGLWDEQTVPGLGGMARMPALVTLGDCTSVVTWSEGDLETPWALHSERVVSSPIGATAATAQLSPASVPTGGTSERVTLSLELTLDEDDSGVDRIHLFVPHPFAFGEIAGVAIDGDPVDAIPYREGPELSFQLDELVTHDGARIDVALDLTADGAVGSEGVLEVTVLHGKLGCPVIADGELTLRVVPADDIEPPPGGDEGCECGVGGSRRAVAVGALAGLAVWLVRRRR